MSKRNQLTNLLGVVLTAAGIHEGANGRLKPLEALTVGGGAIVSFATGIRDEATDLLEQKLTAEERRRAHGLGANVLDMLAKRMGMRVIQADAPLPAPQPQVTQPIEAPPNARQPGENLSEIQQRTNAAWNDAYALRKKFDRPLPRHQQTAWSEFNNQALAEDDTRAENTATVGLEVFD